MDELDSLAAMLEQTERSIRDVLMRALSKEYSEEWETVLGQDMQRKDDYLENLRRIATGERGGSEKYYHLQAECARV